MQYDIVIVGGGLVGAGLAAALRDSGYRIALIEAKTPTHHDHRLFALNASSCQFLQNLGLWPLLADKAAAIHQVHASHQGHFGVVRLTREEVGADSLGHVIPACYVEAALNDVISTLPENRCTIYRPAKLLSLIQHQSNVELVVESQAEKINLQASIVIGADGAASTVRKELNIAAEEVDYQQTAIVFKTTLHRFHQHIAYERFIKAGAIAMLPLPGNQCASICTIKNEKIEEWLSLDDQTFLQQLQQEFGYRLGKLRAVSQRYTYPLRMCRAKEAVKGRVMLIGNAAHTLHPIASQGFNLAVYEVAALADALLAAKHQLAAMDLASVYQSLRKQQEMSIQVSSQLPKIFSAKNAGISAAIQLGMVSLDILPPLKHYFIKGMMGRQGAVPSLLLNTKEI